MNSKLWYIVLCSCVLTAWGAENKSLSDKVEKKETAVKKTDLTAEETRRQSSYKPPLRNIPTPGSDYGLVDEYPPGPSRPVGHSSDYGSSGSLGGYPPSSQISGGYDTSYPSTGYSGSGGCSGGACDSPSSLGGYDMPYSPGGYGPSSGPSYSSAEYGPLSHPSSGYGPSSSSSGGYGPSPHSSSGYGPSSHSSGGYDLSHPSGGYDSPHPSSGYGASPYSPGAGYGAPPQPPSSGYNSPHLSSGPTSLHTPNGYNSPLPNGYGLSKPPRGYSSTQSAGGYGSPIRGYGQSQSPSGYNSPPSSNGYGAYSADAYGPIKPSSMFSEYGPESIRPDIGSYSPTPPRPLSGGGYLKIGSGLPNMNADYSPNAYSSGGHSKPSSASYGGRDSYSKPGSLSGYERKYPATEDKYSSRPYRSADIMSGNYGNVYGSKSRKQSARQSGYAKAPLSSGRYSKTPTRGYDNSDIRYEGSSNTPRDNGYGKSSDRHGTNYKKPSTKSTSYQRSNDDKYSSHSKPQSYSKIPRSKSSENYNKRVKSSRDPGYSNPQDEYNNYDKIPIDYPQDPRSQDYGKPEEYSNYEKETARYAGFKKHPGSAGASQYDGGYGGYATGPPARGFGDLNRGQFASIGNAGGNLVGGFRPSSPLSSLLTGNTFPQQQQPTRGYRKLSQTGYSQAYDAYLGNAGSPNLGEFNIGSDVFSRRGLIGVDHGLYGAASYGKNYGVSRYDDLESKEYSADQSIYGGYSHLY